MTEKQAHPGDGRKTKAIAFIVFIIIAVAVIILLQGRDSLFKLPQKARLAEGSPAPTFVFPGLDGKAVDLRAYKGKVVFLNIWATWCPPCRDEMPSMERLYRQLKGEDFEILAVSVDKAGAAAVAPFVEKNHLTFPILLDPGETMKNIYGTTGVPESFIINREGIIKKIVIGPLDWSTPEVVGFFRDLMQKR